MSIDCWLLVIDFTLLASDVTQIVIDCNEISRNDPQKASNTKDSDMHANGFVINLNQKQPTYHSRFFMKAASFIIKLANYHNLSRFVGIITLTSPILQHLDTRLAPIRYQEIAAGCLFSGPKIKLPVTIPENDCYAAM